MIKEIGDGRTDGKTDGQTDRQRQTETDRDRHIQTDRQVTDVQGVELRGEESVRVDLDHEEEV